MNAPEKDYPKIFLQPACCGDPDVGRLWCEDDAPQECEDGVPWTEYTHHDIHAAVVAERDELRKTIKEMSLLHGYDDGALSDSPFDQLRSIKSALLERDELRRDNAAALRLVADLRFALGDDGQRMQPELIEYAKQLRAEVERLNKLAAAISKDCNETALQRNAAQDEASQLRARLDAACEWQTLAQADLNDGEIVDVKTKDGMHWTACGFSLPSACFFPFHATENRKVIYVSDVAYVMRIKPPAARGE